MTDLSAEQNAMLDQWARRYGFEPYLGDHEDCRCGQCNEYHLVVTALRELLLAVQERDAKRAEASGLLTIADEIREQSYADLFLKEE